MPRLLKIALDCSAWALLLAAAPFANAAEVEEAWGLFWRGQAEEAEEQFTELAEKEPRGALGLARVLTERGETAEAETQLTAAMEKFPEAGELPAERASLAFHRGDYEAARVHIAEALALDENQPLARWLTAELHRVEGRIPEADRAYAWFIDRHNRGRDLDLESLYYIGEAAAQYARWRRNSSQFNFLVNRHYPKLVEKRAEYWPALLAAGRLFLEKYNEPTALRKINEAAAINARAPAIHAARAELALQKFELDRAGEAIAQALAVNPRFLPALQLQADVKLADLRADLAVDLLAEARTVNPRSEETLGRLAAAYLALDGPEETAETRLGSLVAEVEERNPKCGSFFLTMGEALERMRKFPQAAACYRRSLERMPELIDVRGKLGLCLMRLGEEVEAAALLEESFRIDPFNVRVRNMLEVLDVLKGYAVLETEHFVLRFDRGNDAVLIEYAARLLEEEIYPEITEQLGYEPEGKTLIEIFSRAKSTSGHGWFSARMVGLPFIGTVGACAGRMVALASPGDLPKQYNWGRVLRHEFVHVVNLQQTDFNIPHWFTEGQAVWHEQSRRPSEWVRILAARRAADTLFNLETINYGFIRPKLRSDWTLAYCQAELYVEYMIEAHGQDAPARLMAAFRQEPAAPAAIQNAFGVESEAFEAGYREFLGKLLENVDVTADTAAAPALEDLQKQVRDMPEASGPRAALANEYLKRGSVEQARTEAARARELNPKEQLAGYVLARLSLAGGDTAEARRLLEASLDPEKPQPELLALFAGIELQLRDFPRAEALYRLGVEKFPENDAWLQALARLYLTAENAEQLEPVLAELAERDTDAFAYRKKLAELAHAREDFTAAANWAGEALMIQVLDADLHALRGEALARLEQPEAARRHYKTAIELNGRQAEWRGGYARLLIAAGELPAAAEQIDWLTRNAADFADLAELRRLYAEAEAADPR